MKNKVTKRWLCGYHEGKEHHYIHHCLCSPYIQRYIKGISVGDKDGFIGRRCKNMLIPLPPINGQGRIGEKTDLMLAQMQ